MKFEYIYQSPSRQSLNLIAIHLLLKMYAFIDNHLLLQNLYYDIFKISECICYDYDRGKKNLLNLGVTYVRCFSWRELRCITCNSRITQHLSCNNSDSCSHISGGLQSYSSVFPVRCYGELLLAIGRRTLPPHPPCVNILPQQTLHSLSADWMG